MSAFKDCLDQFADQLAGINSGLDNVDIYDRMRAAMDALELAPMPANAQKARSFRGLKDAFEQRSHYTDAFEPYRINGFHDLQWFIEKAREIASSENQ